MSLLRFLSLGRSLDKNRNTYGRFRTVGMNAFIPGFLKNKATKNWFAEPAGIDNEFLEQSETRTQTPTNTDNMNNARTSTDSAAGSSEGPFLLPAEQHDNNNTTSSEESKPTFLRRLLPQWKKSSRRSGTMLLQHVTPVRNDLSLSDLELAPVRNDPADLRSGETNPEQRFLGLFRSRLTLK